MVNVYYFIRYVALSRYDVRHIPNHYLLYRAIIQVLYKRCYDDFSPELCSLIKKMKALGIKDQPAEFPYSFPTMRHFPDVRSTSLTSGTEDQFAFTPTWLHSSPLVCDLYKIKLRGHQPFFSILSTKAIKLTNMASL